MSNTPGEVAGALAIIQSRLDKATRRADQLRAEMDRVQQEQTMLRALIRDIQQIAASQEPEERTTEPARPAEKTLNPADDPAASRSHPATPAKVLGITNALLDLVQSQPGITSDDVVNRLEHLVPSDRGPRRVILNNLGNLVRNGRLQRDEHGRHYLPDGEQSLLTTAG